MKLRKDYEDIYHAVTCSFSVNSVTAAHRAIAAALDRCQVLADSQPRKQLSDEEMLRAFDHAYPVPITRRRKPSANWFNGVRAVVAAAFEKQKERPVEPLDLEKFKTGEWEMLYEGRPTAILGSDTFIHYHERYTMRRKS